MPVPPRDPTSSRPTRTARGSGPGRARTAGPSARPARPARPVRTTSVKPGAPAPKAVRRGGSAAAKTQKTQKTQQAPKPRLTGRAAILVLVLAVLAVSYASSMRAYLQQRSHIESLQSTIAEREGQIDDLEQEKSRWLDPEYVQTQARERLGYVMPGETPYVVLRDGQPLVPEGELSEPPSTTTEPTPFWDDAWESVVLAGNPPRRADPPPLVRVTPPEATTGSDDGSGGESP